MTLNVCKCFVMRVSHPRRNNDDILILYTQSHLILLLTIILSYSYVYAWYTQLAIGSSQVIMHIYMCKYIAIFIIAFVCVCAHVCMCVCICIQLHACNICLCEQLQCVHVQLYSCSLLVNTYTACIRQALISKHHHEAMLKSVFLLA